MRSGTENVAGIAALGKACDMASGDMAPEAERQQQLRHRLEQGISATIPEVRLQGANAARLPNTSNIAFAHVEGETLLMSLDLHGVGISTGSACSSGSLEPSHVLQAMHVPDDYLHGALRFSLGRSTSAEDIDYVLAILPRIIGQARAMAPTFTP